MVSGEVMSYPHHALVPEGPHPDPLLRGEGEENNTLQSLPLVAGFFFSS
jgi:hypothetical protein